MPGYAGARGRPPAVAAPGQAVPPGQRFHGVASGQANTAVVGVTRDGSTGSAVGAVTVEMFLTATNLLIAKTISDGSGNYRFDNPGSGPFFLVAYLAGSPDKAGTTVNTLIAS
jgi:hypothetical protein